MPGPVRVLCSMATRGLLAELAAAWAGGACVEAAGGVEVARRVRAGEAADVVVLAEGPMRDLVREGFLLAGSLVAVAVSGVAVAVRAGEALPDLSDVEALRRAVLGAGRIGYSTGPSGDHLLRLLDGWGVRDAVAGRLVQAPPGVPVGRLLAEGAVDLAVQQTSELIGLPGITLAGPLPPAAACDTMFTAGLTRRSPRPDEAAGFIAALTAAATADTRRRHGLRAPG